MTKKFQTCRLCITCGGDYPTKGGEILGGTWNVYRESCSANLTSIIGNNQLCCSIDQPPCQYCKSCGGVYSQEVGRKYNTPAFNGFSIRGEQCSGGMTQEIVDFSLCCRTRRQCKMCSGNCNGGYSEVSKVKAKDNYWYQWGVYD